MDCTHYIVIIHSSDCSMCELQQGKCNKCNSLFSRRGDDSEWNEEYVKPITWITIVKCIFVSLILVGIAFSVTNFLG